FPFAGREQAQEFLRDAGGQLFQQRGAIVRRNVVENLRDFLLAESLHEVFLVVAIEIFKNLSSEVVRQNAEENGFVVGIEIGENLGNVGRRKAAKDLAKLREVALRDQFLEFRLEQIADHPRNHLEVMRSRKTKKAFAVER